MKFVLERRDGRMLAVPEGLARRGSPDSIGRLPAFDSPAIDPDFSFSKNLQLFLAGKQLLLDEIPFSLEILHDHYLHGFLSYSPGITCKNDQYICQRCGNDVQRLFASYSCARCGSECTYCRKCIMMGRVSQCTPLVCWTGPDAMGPKGENLLARGGDLSQDQRKASEKVAAGVGHNQEMLVWAVCGAGKTEVLFHGIEKALIQGLKVCLASPRTDVILELAPRFREAFPTTELIALYGGSEDRGKQAQLVLTTTHQLLRYKEAFDFIVVDEVDAFPFNSDETLSYAVNKAKKPGAATVYLTATPDASMKGRFNKGDIQGVRIPRRYHNKPLPVPLFRWVGNWRKALEKGNLPAMALEWVIRHCENNRQAFLFVPSIAIMTKVTELLRTANGQITGVHSQDECRKEKIEQFRNGQIPVLVTTTILERGVTVADIDVAVFGADDRVFSEQALVQMSGRVGRSAASPCGEVIFFHNGKTRAMVEAKKHIESMNHEAFFGQRGG